MPPNPCRRLRSFPHKNGSWAVTMLGLDLNTADFNSDDSPQKPRRMPPPASTAHFFSHFFLIHHTNAFITGRYNYCIEACAWIRSNMKAAGVTRLINLLLQYYPKEMHLIVPTNVKRVGSDRSEDATKGCAVVVGCGMCNDWETYWISFKTII